MRTPDVVFRELGNLHDFYAEIAKFRLPRGKAIHKQRQEKPEWTKNAVSEESVRKSQENVE